MIFQKKDKELKEIRLKSFKLEKDLQNLCESNLKIMFNLIFLITEYSISNFRFDTIAYDKENNAFIIIEYKRGVNESLVDQGYAYLHVVLERKADLVLLYNEKTSSSKLVKDFDWESTRIYFVSPQFTTYQRRATGYQKMPFKLFEVNQYQNDIITVDEINENKVRDETKVIRVKWNDEIKEIDKEIKVYTEFDHLSKASPEIEELYFSLKERIITLGRISSEPKKLYIAFKGESNIVDIVIQKKTLKIFINIKKGYLNDPNNMTRLINEVGHWGNGDYQVTIDNNDDIDYLMTLIRQSYKINSMF